MGTVLAILQIGAPFFIGAGVTLLIALYAASR
jgi:hypothetical protein